MISIPTAVEVPLKIDEDGAIRVGGTRVLLEVVIATHRKGYSPEQIVESFPTLNLPDVYAVIAYYLNHRDEVDAYIQEVERAGEEIRRKFEALNPSPLTREILEARLKDRARE